MTYDVIVTHSAERDLTDIIDYIMSQLYSINVAENFLKEFVAKKDFLSDSPYMFSLCNDERLKKAGYHRFVFCKNYIALYRIDDAEKKVYIMRIFYAKRDYTKLV